MIFRRFFSYFTLLKSDIKNIALMTGEEKNRACSDFYCLKLKCAGLDDNTSKDLVDRLNKWFGEYGLTINERDNLVTTLAQGFARRVFTLEEIRFIRYTCYPIENEAMRTLINLKKK